MSVAGLGAQAGQRCAARAAGRDVLAIQDTSEIALGGLKLRAKGFGPVGKGGAVGGVLLHPVLAVDAGSGALLGLVDVAVWNRDTGKMVEDRARRASADRESQRWRTGAQRAGEVLASAARITAVSDRESDIYEDFACRPANVHLLVRARHDRILDRESSAAPGRLFGYLDSLPETMRITVDIPAAPGRAARKAVLALRFGPVTVRAPTRGMPAHDLKALPASLLLHGVDIREADAPGGIEPIHWRLLTSHTISSAGQARMMLDFYRRRWIVEEYFRTLKTAGFQIEDADIGDPRAMMNFTALAAIAAVTVTQLLRARDNPEGQGLGDAFDAHDQPLLEAINASYEGPRPTARLTNPHQRGTLAFATWVIARLGGWTVYYGKPGPNVLSRGLKDFQAIKYGAGLARGHV